jgi:putative nucleotidyltransferase with HDIG domain
MSYYDQKKIDKIPSREECNELMAQYSMLPNIVEHSIQVMHVSLAITDNLKSGVFVNRDMVVAAALLHDITKTRSLVTKERHDTSGGDLLRELGFPLIAEIVEQHVIIQNINLEGRLEEREIVYYADKRVLHDTIVTINERLLDLMERYGTGEEIRNMILQNKDQVLRVERKIASFMKNDIDQAIQSLVEAPTPAFFSLPNIS